MKNLISFIMLLGVCFLGGIVGKFLDPPKVQADNIPQIVRQELPPIVFPDPGKIQFSVDMLSGKISVDGQVALEQIDVNIAHAPEIEYKYVPVPMSYGKVKTDTVYVESYPYVNFGKLKAEPKLLDVPRHPLPTTVQ